MAVSIGRRLAAQAQVPVHAIAGAGAQTALLALRARKDVELVASPRHATILLVAGAVPSGIRDAVAQVHDQLPAPRAVVWWGGEDVGALGIDGTATVEPDGDVVEALRRVHGELLVGERPSTAPVGPGANPVPWQGVGPHGQGGEGMMGGRPYGRAMAMTGPDVRDGLQLDRVSLRVGPALPGLAPGLALDVELQGDVIAQAGLTPNPFASPERHGLPLPSLLSVWDAARRHPVALADVETARARYHVLRLADALSLTGLAATARRLARVATGLTPTHTPVLARLRHRVDRGLWGATAGVGTVDGDAARTAGLAGVTARAAGVAVDARSTVPAYQQLGFTPVTGGGGDARDRWMQRLDEAAQALRLAAAAGGATVGPGDGLEDPRDDSAALLDRLPGWLAGLEWGDAITLLASLDLDLEAAVEPTGAAA